MARVSGGRSAGRQHAGPAPRHGLAQHLVELLDVARPAVAHQHPHRLRRAGQLAAPGQPGDQVRHQLGDVLDVVPQRRHLDRAREARPAARRRARRRTSPPPADGGGHPRPLRVGRLAVRLQRVDQRLPPVRAQPVDVGEHQRAGVAGLQLLDHLGDPVRAVVGGVQHPEVPGRGAGLVGGPGQGGLAGARLALQDQPLPGLEVPVDRLAALGPQQPGADRGGQRGGAAGWRSAAGRWRRGPPAARAARRRPRSCRSSSAGRAPGRRRRWAGRPG